MRRLILLLFLLSVGATAWAGPAADFRRPAVWWIEDQALSPNAEAIARGRAVFGTPGLTGPAAPACDSCHDPERDFQDGAGHDLGQGVRRTPSLLDAAWSASLFWDGRAGRVEDALRDGATGPHAPALSDADLGAVAGYVRAQLSGQMAFDRFIDGFAGAMSDAAVRGFGLFSGKAGCVACHAGWRLTDDGFHDIGLPPAGGDRGRGAAVGEAGLDRAFRTPSLRNLARRKSLMHDGRFTAIPQAVDHYLTLARQQPTGLDPELGAIGRLSEGERDDLIAFLYTLAEDAPPPFLVGEMRPRLAAEPAHSVQLTADGFDPPRVAVAPGEVLTLVNADDRDHWLRGAGAGVRFDGGRQAPGAVVSATMPETAGVYRIVCAIYPGMVLTIEIAGAPAQ